LELGLFLNILSLFLLLLLGNFGFLDIVLNSLFESKLLSFQSILELDDSLILDGGSDLFIKLDTGDDTSLDQDTLVGKICVQVIEHSFGMLLSSEGVSLTGLDLSGKSSNSFHDVGIDGLINLWHIGGKLLHILVFWHDLEQDGQTDSDVKVISSQHSVVWTFIHKILLGDEVLGLSERQRAVHTWISVLNESSTGHNNCDDSFRTIFIRN